MNIDVPLDRQIAEVKRELGMRRGAFRRFVAVGAITQQQADERYAALEAVLATLQRLHADEQAKQAPGLF